MRWTGYVACMGDMRNGYKILVGKFEGKKPHKWEDNIKMEFREVCLEGVDWIHVVQDRYQWQALVDIVMNLNIPLKAGNLLTA
jgi:hypothetical protein